MGRKPGSDDKTKDDIMARINCGNCKQVHGTVAEVRSCYGNSGRLPNAELPKPTAQELTTKTYGRGSEQPATEKQIRFLTALARGAALTAIPMIEEQGKTVTSEGIERVVAEEVAKYGVDRTTASQAIDDYLAGGTKPTWDPITDEAEAEGDTPDAPAGRYALEASDGHVVFYKVDRPTRGKWAGHVFVKQLIGAPGDFTEQRLSRANAATVLERISSDPAEAALRFSRKFTVCARCLSPLSQVRSRATGFGSTCAGYLGVRYLSREEALVVLDEQGISTDGLEDLEEVTV